MNGFPELDFEQLVKGLSSSKPMGTKQDTFLLLVSSQPHFQFEAARDQQKFLDAFVALLENTNQSLCIRHFIGCLAPIEDAVTEGLTWASSTEHNRSALRLHQHRFLSAPSSWMLKPRSQEECKALWLTQDASDDMDSHRCLQAGCDLNDPFVALLHKIGTRHRGFQPRSMARTAFHIISGTLFSAAEAIKTAKSARRVEKAVNTAGLGQPWPTTVTDLLGDYAVEIYLKQMEVWIDAWPYYSYPYCILGSLAVLCPLQFLAPIAQSTIIPFHTITILATINKDEKVAATIPVICSHLLKEIPRMLSREDLGRFPGWLESKADRCKKTLLRLGSTVHAYTSMADDEYDDIQFDSRMLDMSHAKQQKASGTITGAFDAFCSLAEWQRCFSPGCNGMEAVASLRKCSTCGRVLYCSTSCQKEAWRHPAAPHKDLCKFAKSLVDRTGLPSRPDPSEDLDSFYRRIDGNEEMEQLAKKFGECFQKIATSLGEGMTTRTS
ncbi:hypothetical protein B0H11DRAFT_1915666 [Mycena galericulata]|nr:hypothetical protein B0H11DRAFT_1915666 [Mycena galericulata]